MQVETDTEGIMERKPQSIAGRLLYQRVMIVGELTVFDPTAKSFTILLDNGLDVEGVAADGDADCFAYVGLGDRVCAAGNGVYEAKGGFLRIEDADLYPSNPGRPSHLPALGGHAGTEKPSNEPIAGQWPGDETDEEIEAALRELS